MDVDLAVLGHLRVVVDGVDVTPRAHKARALLGLLAMSRGKVVSVDHLLNELWPDLPSERGRRVLHVRVAEVRKQFRRASARPLLESVDPGYRLRADEITLDADTFIAGTERARELAAVGDTLGAATLLREALGLWRGDPLADVRCSADLDAEAALLTDLRLAAVEERIAVELRDGCHHRLIPEIDALVAQHPWRERLVEQQVLALYRCGRQVDALRACAGFRRRLAEDLGLEPGVALRQLETDVLEHRDDLQLIVTPSTRAVVPDPHSSNRVALNTGTEAPSATTAPPPVVRYVKTDDGVNLAYQIAGDGPTDLVIVPGFISELDNWWEAWDGRLVRRLASFSRLILYDKRGTGLSDRPTNIEIEDWVDDVRVVLDAAGAVRPAVLGMSAGGAIAALFAAKYPDRVAQLVLYGTAPRYLADSATGYPGWSRDELDATFAKIESHWGTGDLLRSLCPSAARDPRLVAQFGQYERRSASPGAAVEYLRALSLIDVRYALPLITAPTLVLHGTRDEAAPVALARATAEQIPHAALQELDTSDHLIWFSDAVDAITDEIEAFLMGASPAEDSDVILTTVVAVRLDTDDAAGLGVVASEVERFRGRTTQRAGRELVAAFDGPARAVRCAHSALALLSERGVGARAGVHSGECTVNGTAITGEAVTTASWIASIAHSGEILVSQTVHDVVTSGSFTFSDRGHHVAPTTKRGWQLFATERVVLSLRDGALAPSP